MSYFEKDNQSPFIEHIREKTPWTAVPLSGITYVYLQSFKDLVEALRSSFDVCMHQI